MRVSVVEALWEPLAVLLAWEECSWATLRVSFSMRAVRRSRVSVGLVAAGDGVTAAAGVVVVVWEPGVWMAAAAAMGAVGMTSAAAMGGVGVTSAAAMGGVEVTSAAAVGWC